ncbi:MAG: hypothetical protein JOZ53_12910 [Planctomycetaceae bacterium]|nr:hypothetical protein [Planctomycetaceae bacterium]
MRHQSPISEPQRPEPESYLSVLADLGSVLLGVTALLAVVLSRQPRQEPPKVAVQAPPVPVPAPAPPVSAPKPAEAPQPEPRPRPAPEPSVEPDRAAIARAEEALDAASRDRARAEARAAEAARQLAEATRRAASDAASSRTLALRVRDPSTQIARASARGGELRTERDRLKEEVAALARMPRPKAKSIVDRTPVAKPAGGDEYHFEVRRNRVSYIDLDRLMALVKSDAQLRVRLSDNARLIDSKVGPAGAFSLRYVLGKAMPQGIEELLERHGLSYDLRGWEILPEFEGRGETYEMSREPISEYARVINRLNPTRATITMWIYPDGFSLYRKLRDDLHERGFLVAARPLPEGMPIRGSPGGSLSAGQ